ncbi:cation/calcium exchanger 4-like [Wolffia australiana]
MNPVGLRRRRRLRQVFLPVLFNLALTLLLFFVFYNGGASIRTSPSPIDQTYRPRRDLGEIPAVKTGSCASFKAHPETSSGGFIDYLRFFYCDCENLRALGYGVLILWLAALFYLLGNTAADFFCPSLEKLSGLLRLPPTVAGVTLLPLGNGAPDVFSSIAAMVGSGAGEVGLNSVLGGAVFVTCVVVGVVSLSIAEKRVQIDRSCFTRDVVFFLGTLLGLSLILAVGKVPLWGALVFVSVYLVYAVIVAANELLKRHAPRLKLASLTPLLPVRASVLSLPEDDDDGGGGGNSIRRALLELDSPGHGTPSLPQWMWASNFAIYSNQGPRRSSIDNPRPLWGWADDADEEDERRCCRLLRWLQAPLSLPRRLTIPIVDDDRWSKGYAVASAFLAPLLVAILWTGGRAGPILVCAAVGAGCAAMAAAFTSSDRPPRRFLLPWVAGGFVMSVVWFYVIAGELVALLVALGEILGVEPAVLAVTVLAWGNSMGDLSSNLAMAMAGSEDGVQIAMVGCYAGPMFNTLIGLGMAMVLSAWAARPAALVLPVDPSLALTIVFLVLGLVWALVVLTRNQMRPSRLLGFGLLGIYAVFLCARLGTATGFISTSDFRVPLSFRGTLT